MAFSINITNAMLANTATITGYPFSLVGWFRVPSVSVEVSLLGLVSFATGARCDVLYAGNTTQAAVAKAQFGTSVGSASSTIAMTPGTWHHLVAVFASDSSRSIYLDGGNVGIDTTSVSVSQLDFFYLGNISNSNSVDLAEVSIIEADVSANQAAVLACGSPVLSIPLAHNAIAHQDCIRQHNRPGLGPIFTSTGTPGVVDHPRVHFPTGETMKTMPLRFAGPWQVEQCGWHAASTEIGQHVVSGIAMGDSILAGEVMS